MSKFNWICNYKHKRLSTCFSKKQIISKIPKRCWLGIDPRAHSFVAVGIASSTLPTPLDTKRKSCWVQKNKGFLIRQGTVFFKYKYSHYISAVVAHLATHFFSSGSGPTLVIQAYFEIIKNLLINNQKISFNSKLATIFYFTLQSYSTTVQNPQE